MEFVPFLFDYWWLVAILWLAIFTFIGIFRKAKAPRDPEVDTHIMGLRKHVEERESQLLELADRQLKRQAERRKQARDVERRSARK